MNQILLEKTLKLKEEIESLPEVVELERLSELIQKDEKVMALSYRKDVCASKFGDAVKTFGENSKEAIEAQKELYQAKLELDNNELVKAYNKQYSIVRDIYAKINKCLFGPFIK